MSKKKTSLQELMWTIHKLTERLKRREWFIGHESGDQCIKFINQPYGAEFIEVVWK